MNFLCVSVKSRKSLLVLMCLILCLVLVSEFTSAVASGKSKGETEAQRLEFMHSIGVFPDMSGETSKDAVIPETFSDVYADYNGLQLKAGYDLSNYRGEKVKIYEYLWERESGQTLYVHLIVHKKEIIGGDICDNRLNGEMYPLEEMKWEK